MSRFKKLCEELNMELDKVTLRELADDVDNIQADLTNISTAIQDYLSLINNRKRAIILKNVRKKR